MEIKEILLQEEVRRAKAATDRKPKRRLLVFTLPSLALYLVGLYSISFASQIGQLVESDPFTGQYAPAHYFNYNIHPDWLCDDELIMTYDDQPICGAI